MTSDHDPYAEWSAAFLLGALEPAERASFQRHLATCALCQAEVAEFSAIPGLLARITPQVDDASAMERIRSAAIRDSDKELARIGRTVRRWRAAAMSTAAALVIVCALLAATQLGSDVEPPAGIELVFDSDASGSVTIAERAWGTHITIDLQGLPDRQGYQLWAVEEDGTWSRSATWSPTPSGKAVLTTATAVTVEQIDRIVVTSDSRVDVVLDAAA